MKRLTPRALPILLMGSVLLTLASCDNFSLDEPGPIGSLNENTFYQTPDDFRAAIYNAYTHQLYWYGDATGLSGYWAVVVYPSDDLKASPLTPNDFDNFNWQPTAGAFNRYWNESYDGISVANSVIEQLPDAPIEDELKAELRGEARFLRGYYTFVLARLFGNVPIVRNFITTIDSTDIGNRNQDISAVWDFITADFRAAAETLPPTRNANNKGRATSAAANAFLGKTLLFRAQWSGNDAYYEDAITAFNKVVNDPNVDLVADYRDNFRIATENNQESLYEVQNTAETAFGAPNSNPWVPPSIPYVYSDNTMRHMWMRAADGMQGDGLVAPLRRVGGRYHVTESAQAEFEDHDPRRFASYYVPGEIYSKTVACPPASDPEADPVIPCIYKEGWTFTGSTPAKYIRPFESVPGAWANFTNNERVLRYADVLLMLAEAEFLTGNAQRAADLINQVRARSRDDFEEACANSAVGLGCGSTAPEEVLPPVTAAEMTHATIRHERRVELFAEGKRYEDLVRWHRAGLINIAADIDFGTANASWSETNLLRPIPQNELDVNPNLVQNPGY